jgi:serine/threonine protein kinase
MNKKNQLKKLPALSPTQARIAAQNSRGIKTGNDQPIVQNGRETKVATKATNKNQNQNQTISTKGLLSEDYDFTKKLGSGSFGDVWCAIDKKATRSLQSDTHNGIVPYTENSSNVKYVAIKVEHSKKKERSRVLEEYKIYKYLRDHGFIEGIAKLHNYIEIPGYNMLVMELLGPSLEDMFNKHKRIFKLSTVFAIALQLIDLIETLHSLSFIHRDIKPNNFSLGYRNYQQIYMLDFGLSKKFYSKEKGHIPMNKDKHLVGTVRYVSKNMHMGIEPSRRDDLESIGYMLIYFAKGELPWQGLNKKLHGINGQNIDHKQKIGEIKHLTKMSSLCSGLPKCFNKYLEYCGKLKFAEKPNYDYLKDLFIKSSQETGIEAKFEWSNQQ